MRKLYIIAFSLFVFSVNANAVRLTPTLDWISYPANGHFISGNGTGHLSAQFSLPENDGSIQTFDHDWVFSLTGDAEIVIATSADPLSYIEMITFTFEGTELPRRDVFNWDSGFVVSGQSTHTLNVKGTYDPLDPDFDGLYTVQVVSFGSPVPIPAAFWLFGSAILGVRGFAKYRKSLAV
jgi:hypothetical protein